MRPSRGSSSHRRKSAFASWRSRRRQQRPRPGRHRAPSTAGRTAARWTAAGIVASTPLVTVATADASGGMPPDTRDAVISCESGGDPQAQNNHSTASGAYQFINATWKTYGGSTTRARDASLAEQHRVADRAFVKNGLRDWAASRACWGPKIGRHAAEREAPHVVDTHHAHRRHHRTVGQIHVVQRGDTLSGIAAAHELSLRTIIAANREIIDDPDRIYPGQRIRI